MDTPSTVRSILNFFLRPTVRYIVAWLIVAGAGGITFYRAWTAFDGPRRPDGTSRRIGGNHGHTMIDFGAQWLMGRMVTEGFGRELYHRNRLRQVAREAYPQSDEVPPNERKPEELDQHDAENLMVWMMGQDDPSAGADGSPATPQLGGPLYPPIHGLVMLPLGYLRPALAYRLVQVFGILLSLVAGWGIVVVARGRIWWPVAISAIILFPGYSANLNLGQNGILVLTLLIGGWALLSRGWPQLAGISWGLLAFKPVWAAAFFLVPLLTGRWRVCASMLATIVALFTATLWFADFRTWLEWFQVGRDAAALYGIDENWVHLSRDLVSIPRRWLLNFATVDPNSVGLAADLAGWAILLGVFECTVRLVILRRDQARAFVGPPAAFLLFGAWLSGFHFMYYDILLTALPVLLLLTDPVRFLRPVLVIFRSLAGNRADGDLADYFSPRLASTYPRSTAVSQVGYHSIGVLNSMTLSLIVLLLLAESLLPYLGIAVSVSVPGLANSPIPMPLKYSTAIPGTPWSTFCIIALWLWCGWLLLRQARVPAEPATA
jgi:hypothetical protein